MKKRVHVKATRRSKAHYRMQEVGRKEPEKVISDKIWEITRGDFNTLIKANKISLKEKYIKEHGYKFYDEHPQLKYLVGLMNDKMRDRYEPKFYHFNDGFYSLHEQSVSMALISGIPVPLHVLKDYSDLAYSFDIDISEEALKNEPVISKDINNLYEMSKDDYDQIMEEVRKDCINDPKKITDTMLNRYYANELISIKKNIKLRKKIYDNLPVAFKKIFSLETMNMELHRQVIKMTRNSEEIPIEVKNNYPMIFDVPINYSSIGDPVVDGEINKTMEIIRSDVNTGKKISDSIRDIIGSTGIQQEIILFSSGNERRLIESGIKDIFSLLNHKLVDVINDSDTDLIIDYDSDIDRSNFREKSEWDDPATITLGESIIDVNESGYKRGVMCHEYGHAIEYMIPGISKLSNKFLDRRTEKDVVTKLNNISQHYDNDEYTKVDNFINPYIGKIYGGGETEVLSMGMGYMTNEFDQAKLYRDDPEYLGFIVSILAGKIGI